VMALWYILYYNLIAPRLPGGRAYVRAVDSYLDDVRRDCARTGPG
jgi:hypothetical protein